MAETAAPDPAGAAPTIAIELVYCKSRSAVDSTQLRLPPHACVEDALNASGIRLRHPEIDADGVAVGIWGRSASPGQVLRDGDRVEIYRPLQVDPKEARRRRQRVQQGKKRAAKGA